MTTMNYETVLSGLNTDLPIGFNDSFEMARSCADMLADEALEEWGAIENRLRDINLRSAGLLDYEVKKLRSALGS